MLRLREHVVRGDADGAQTQTCQSRQIARQRSGVAAQIGNQARVQLHHRRNHRGGTALAWRIKHHQIGRPNPRKMIRHVTGYQVNSFPGIPSFTLGEKGLRGCASCQVLFDGHHLARQRRQR